MGRQKQKMGSKKKGPEKEKIEKAQRRRRQPEVEKKDNEGQWVIHGEKDKDEGLKKTKDDERGFDQQQGKDAKRLRRRRRRTKIYKKRKQKHVYADEITGRGGAKGNWPEATRARQERKTTDKKASSPAEG